MFFFSYYAPWPVVRLAINPKKTGRRLDQTESVGRLVTRVLGTKRGQSSQALKEVRKDDFFSYHRKNYPGAYLAEKRERGKKGDAEEFYKNYPLYLHY